jgi:beta-glucosidase-like glycosyl hydrolase
VNQAVSRILEKRFELGLFDPLTNQQYIKYGVNDINSTSAWSFTLEATLQGYTLLKNDNSLLPLTKGKRIALVGPHIISQQNLFEDYADGMCFLYGYQCTHDR